jgi:hypothetical protein
MSPRRLETTGFSWEPSGIMVKMPLELPLDRAKVIFPFVPG